MASLIANCLTKLVTAKKISQRAADAALALHEGAQDRLYPSMPPASADAAAALEAARVMADSAKRRKYRAALIAIGEDALRTRMTAHTKGKISGLISAVTRDVWDDGVAGVDKRNVESLSDAISQEYRAKLRPLIEAYQSRWAGLVADNEAIFDVVREVYGRDTGDAVAKQAAKAWDNVATAATNRAERAGIDFQRKDDWRLPQMWDSRRIRKFTEQEFLNDVMAEVKVRGLRLRDKATGADATAIAVPGIIQNSYQDIFHGRGANGSAGGFSNKTRVFQFDDPESYIRLMRKYGFGDAGLYNVLLGHTESMARETALAEIFTPNYKATFAKLLIEASEDYTSRMHGRTAREKAKGIAAKVGRSFLLETPTGAKRIFQAVTGELSEVEGEMLAGFMSGVRQLSSAARLGSAVVSAVPGDSVTAGLAANHLGIPPTAVLARFLKEIAGGGEVNRELAAQLGISSAAIRDSVLRQSRYSDEFATGFPARVSDTMHRAAGMQAWTEGMKRSSSMELMGLVGRQSEFAFDKVEPEFRGFLQRYGFTPDNWDVLRSGDKLVAEGARFWDAQSVPDKVLADRMLSAITDERRFFVVEPDARVRAMAAGGAKRGTWSGEAWRNGFMFKSFPISIMMTHMMRNMMEGDLSSRVYRTAAYTLATMVGGAVALQVSQLLTGKDPQPMDDLRFWGAAFMRGGGAGFYGDLLYSATTRGGDGITQALAGPVTGNALEAAGKIATGNADGADFARWMKAFTPGSTLWYTRAVTDRFIFDQMQALIDPDYRKSFAREESRIRKDFGQGYWWKRGKLTPDRAPDFENLARK